MLAEDNRLLTGTLSLTHTMADGTARCLLSPACLGVLEDWLQAFLVLDGTADYADQSDFGSVIDR